MPIDQRQRRNHFEIDQRLHADLADLLQVAHRGDALHNHAEDHRRDHHPDQRDKRHRRAASAPCRSSEEAADRACRSPWQSAPGRREWCTRVRALSYRCALAHSSFSVSQHKHRTYCPAERISHVKPATSRGASFPDEQALDVAPRGAAKKCGGLARHAGDVRREQHAPRRFAFEREQRMVGRRRLGGIDIDRRAAQMARVQMRRRAPLRRRCRRAKPGSAPRRASSARARRSPISPVVRGQQRHVQGDHVGGRQQLVERQRLCAPGLRRRRASRGAGS